MPDAKTPSVFALREPKPGQVEALIVEGEEAVYALSHGQLWRIVSEGLQMLRRWPHPEKEKA